MRTGLPGFLVFPDKLRVSLFPDWFPRYAWTAAKSARYDLVGSRVYACLSVTCHLRFWQNDRGLLRATDVARGWNGHQIKDSSQSSLWRRKFARRSLRESHSRPFDHESGALPTRYPGTTCTGLVYVCPQRNVKKKRKRNTDPIRYHRMCAMLGLNTRCWEVGSWT